MAEQVESKETSVQRPSKDALSLRSLGYDTLRWCTRHAVGNWFVFASFVCGIGAAIAAQWEPNPTAVKIKGTLSVAAIALQAIGWGLGLGAKRLCDKVRSENDSLRNRLQRVSLIEENVESIFGVWLNLILSEMKMDGECRASFYVWDDKGCVGNEFVYLARESNDPVLKRKGRERFPGTQGVISEAWHDNNGMASYFASKNVKTDADVVDDMVKRYGFSRSVAEGLTMKSRVILGHVIVGRQGKLGIVVIESLQKVSKKEKREAYQKRCADVVKKVTPHITRLFEIYSNSMFKQEDPTEEQQ